MKRAEKQNWRPFSHLLGHSGIPWRWYAVNFMLGLAISMITVKLPQMAGAILQGEIFDRGVIGTYLAVTLFSMALGFFSSVFGSWIRLSTDQNLQCALWSRVLRLPLAAYQELGPSSFITRVTKDTSGISQGISNFLSIFTNTWTIFLMLKTVYEMDRGMVAAMAVMIPWVVAVAAVTGRYSFLAGSRMQESLADFTSVITERLANMKGIRIHGEAHTEWEKGIHAAEKQYKAELYRARVNLCSQPFIYMSEAFLKALLLIYGGILISRNELGSGEFITIYMYLEMLPVFAVQYILIYQNVKGVQGAAVRAGEILQEPVEEADRGEPVKALNRDIVFRDVSFGYRGNKVLHHAGFTVPAGKTTAIVGPSGSGKTTVLKLLERFYDPDDGEILAEGKDISKMRLGDWRAYLCYVPQDSPILSGTVWENLTYGWKQTGDRQEVIKAMEYANASEFILKRPKQLQAETGEKGGRFSAGERQRLAIARALVKDPQFLLLDEATCNLDACQASEVQASVKNMMGMRTCVVVAHDMEIARGADHIVVLNHGCVCGEGSHRHLYETCDTYRNLVDMQEKEHSWIN